MQRVEIKLSWEEGEGEKENEEVKRKENCKEVKYIGKKGNRKQVIDQFEC